MRKWLQGYSSSFLIIQCKAATNAFALWSHIFSGYNTNLDCSIDSSNVHWAWVDRDGDVEAFPWKIIFFVQNFAWNNLVRYRKWDGNANAVVDLESTYSNIVSPNYVRIRNTHVVSYSNPSLSPWRSAAESDWIFHRSSSHLTDALTLSLPHTLSLTLTDKRSWQIESVIPFSSCEKKSREDTVDSHLPASPSSPPFSLSISNPQCEQVREMREDRWRREWVGFSPLPLFPMNRRSLNLAIWFRTTAVAFRTWK